MHEGAERSEECQINSIGRNIVVRVPNTNIDSLITFSRWRAALAVVGILLAITDIPRTGLAYTTTRFYEDKSDVAADVVMYWGPFERHSAHLRVLEEANHMGMGKQVSASRDGVLLDLIDQWPYKFDTQSIALRAAAELLNVTSYLPCLLYHTSCWPNQLEPNPVFVMLDDLVIALATKVNLLGETGASRCIVFVSISKWIDRLHHFFSGFLVGNHEIRVHTVHFVKLREQQRDALCGTNESRTGFNAQHRRPGICDSSIAWMCAPPNNRSQSHITISNHINLRLGYLHKQYPDLAIDLTVLSSSLVSENHARGFIPSVRTLTKTEEVVTLIRGRRCSSSNYCETIFVDDFRYERSWIESDGDQWVNYVTILRGFSQTYMWVRVGLLIFGCYRAWVSEAGHRGKGFRAQWIGTWATLLKIPSHVFVFGSWLPIAGYALAHYCDSNLIQSIGDYAFATVGGQYRFDPIEYTAKVSIHMRNIWMIALFFKYAFFIANATGRRVFTWYHVKFDGLVTLRPHWIGIVSYLTTFGMMRAIRFRDSRVISVYELPPGKDLTLANALGEYQTVSVYGIRFDLICSFVAGVCIMSAAWVGSIAIRVTTCQETSFLTCRSFYIPSSAGRLWPWSVLDGTWIFSLRAVDQKPTTRIVPTAWRPEPALVFHPVSKIECTVCRFVPSLVHWRATHGCALHDPIFDVPRRSDAVWSIVRLTNIAVMTDPIVFFRLTVVGVPLYVYRVQKRTFDTPYAVLLPTPPRKNASPSRHVRSAWSDEHSEEMVYVATVDSRDVPWHALVNCG